LEDIIPKGILPFQDYTGDIWSREYLTGDWEGTRTDLVNNGIRAEIQWTQVVQSVVDGGTTTATKYGGSFDFNLRVDLMRMGVMPGALISFRAESKYGEAINDRIGTLMPANIDAFFPLKSPQDEDIPLTITNLNYTQFLGEQFGLTIGKFDTLDGDPNEFAGGRGVSQFMNANFLFHSPGALIVPYSTIGGGVIIIPNKQLLISSILVNSVDASTTTGFDDIGDGWTWLTSVQFQYQLANLPGGINAAFAYAFDSDFTEINGIFTFLPGEGLVPSTEDESWMVSLSGWQYIHTEEQAKEGPVDYYDGQPDYQGFGVFYRIALSDEDTNPIDFFASFGLGGRGCIPGRDDDTFGVGYFYLSIQATTLGGIVGIDSKSQGVEAFYNIAITPAAHLTCDIQIIDSPKVGVDTAVVLGVRMNLRF